MVQNLKDQIKLRGLEESGAPATPLRDFEGMLQGWEPYELTATWGKSIMVKFNFTELNVLESITPYGFPQATVEIRYSEKANSKWGIFAKSASAYIPADEELDWLIGKNIHIKLTPGHLLWNGTAEVDQSCFEMVGIAGDAMVSGVAVNTGTSRQIAVDIADGKTEAEFNQASMANPTVAADSDLIEEIMGGEFLSGQVAINNLTLDGEVYHKAK